MSGDGHQAAEQGVGEGAAALVPPPPPPPPEPPKKEPTVIHVPLKVPEGARKKQVGLCLPVSLLPDHVSGPAVLRHVQALVQADWRLVSQRAATLICGMRSSGQVPVVAGGEKEGKGREGQADRGDPAGRARQAGDCQWRAGRRPRRATAPRGEQAGGAAEGAAGRAGHQGQLPGGPGPAPGRARCPERRQNRGSRPPTGQGHAAVAPQVSPSSPRACIPFYYIANPVS